MSFFGTRGQRLIWLRCGLPRPIGRQLFALRHGLTTSSSVRLFTSARAGRRWFIAWRSTRRLASSFEVILEDKQVIVQAVFATV